MEERFKNADKNNDNQITLEEAKNGMPRVAAHFDVIDVDRNGYASMGEIKAAMAKFWGNAIEILILSEWIQLNANIAVNNWGI